MNFTHRFASKWRIPRPKPFPGGRARRDKYEERETRGEWTAEKAAGIDNEKGFQPGEVSTAVKKNSGISYSRQKRSLEC